jgi:hypothetical protein
MAGDTVLTLANLKGLDLDCVRTSDIDLEVFAEHVAKEPRYNGATPRVWYSVAQHLCLGADAMLSAGATETEAAYFLCHDIPEGIWKDDPTPKKVTIAKRIERKCGVTSQAILDVLKELDAEHEAAVHQAAGLPYPIPEEIHRLVKLYDVIMFVTEWRDLMRNAPHPNWLPYSKVQPLTIKIEPWDWQTAERQLLFRMRKLLPNMQRRK